MRLRKALVACSAAVATVSAGVGLRRWRAPASLQAAEHASADVEEWQSLAVRRPDLTSSCRRRRPRARTGATTTAARVPAAKLPAPHHPVLFPQDYLHAVSDGTAHAGRTVALCLRSATAAWERRQAALAKAGAGGTAARPSSAVLLADFLAELHDAPPEQRPRRIVFQQLSDYLLERATAPLADPAERRAILRYLAAALRSDDAAQALLRSPGAAPKLLQLVRAEWWGGVRGQIQFCSVLLQYGVGVPVRCTAWWCCFPCSPGGACALRCRVVHFSGSPHITLLPSHHLDPQLRCRRRTASHCSSCWVHSCCGQCRHALCTLRTWQP